MLGTGLHPSAPGFETKEKMGGGGSRTQETCTHACTHTQYVRALCINSHASA